MKYFFSPDPARIWFPCVRIHVPILDGPFNFASPMSRYTTLVFSPWQRRPVRFLTLAEETCAYAKERSRSQLSVHSEMVTLRGVLRPLVKRHPKR